MVSHAHASHLAVLLTVLAATCALAKDDSLPWTLIEPELRFSAENLDGHIDGGAELVLEFGFAELQLQRYLVGHAEVAVESYQMESPAAALGIYLMKCGGETPLSGVDARNTGNRYQLTAVKGSKFLQINNFGGESALLPAMAALAQTKLAATAAAESLAIWEALPAGDRVPGSELLIRGVFALQPIYTLGAGDILQLNSRIFGAVADYRDEAGSVHTCIVVPYPDHTTAGKAYAHLVTNLDPYLTLVHQTENMIVFQDYRDHFGSARLVGNTLQVRVNLQTRPVE